MNNKQVLVSARKQKWLNNIINMANVILLQNVKLKIS